MIRASDVSLIVPVGGAAPAWKRSAESFARLDPPPGEIIVVIDGPAQTQAAQAQTAQAEAIDAEVVVLEQNSGPAVARNRGAEIAQGEILFFVDSDVETPPGIIAHVADVFSATDAPSAVIGSYDEAPGDPSFLSQYRNLLHHYVHQTSREEATTFWGACGAVLRSAFESVGGFDESFPEPSIEDIELGSRLVLAGHSIRLVKDLQIKHLKTWRLMNMLETDLWKRAVPWTRLMLGGDGLVNDLNVKTKDRLGVVLSFIALLALLASPLFLPLIAVAAAAWIGIIGLNRDLFRFFRRVRKSGFALCALPAYWMYLLICGLGFAIGLGAHSLNTQFPSDLHE